MGTALLELRCWNFVGKSVEDIREAFAAGIRTKYILPLSSLFLPFIEIFG